jgi:hypothetical protein
LNNIKAIAIFSERKKTVIISIKQRKNKNYTNKFLYLYHRPLCYKLCNKFSKISSARKYNRLLTHFPNPSSLNITVTYCLSIKSLLCNTYLWYNNDTVKVIALSRHFEKRYYSGRRQKRFQCYQKSFSCFMEPWYCCI